MYTVRCTRKLLRAVRFVPGGSDRPTTTALGDWYANTLYLGRLRLIHFLSERSLLSVVIPLKPSKTCLKRHRVALIRLLRDLQLDQPLAQEELTQMESCAIGLTASRSILSSLRVLSNDAKWVLTARPETSLPQLNLELADTPCLTLPIHFPNQMTRVLLETHYPSPNPTVRAA
jgi:hypothetical protein